MSHDSEDSINEPEKDKPAQELSDSNAINREIVSKDDIYDGVAEEKEEVPYDSLEETSDDENSFLMTDDETGNTS